MGSPSEIPPEALLGGKIRLIQRIGRGGMGDVWVARNEATQAEVAVKTLQRSERTATHDERFRREARLAATISHRNVVRIFDLVDDADGTLGLVMELLRGGTLENCMRERGCMSTMHSVAVAAPILSALNHVHAKGIIHRDVKPANIFFAVEPDGHVIPKILDFGIAKLPASGASSLTVDGSVLGTPHYMSPEQIRGQEEVDGRSDMFSLAVVLYEMLTGVRVFQRDSAAASLAAVLEHEVDPDPKIEPRIWVAISRALAKRPYERFANCNEFAEALRAAVDATEEDYSASLQELQPRSDALPESEIIKLGGLTSTGTRAKKKPKPKQPRNVLWTVGAAGVAAVLAVTATLAIKGSSSSDDAHAATGSTGVPSSSAGTVSVNSLTTPVGSAQGTVTSPVGTGSAVETPTDLGDLGGGSPGASPTGKNGTRPGVRPPHSGGRPAGKPAGSAKPVGTTPGF